MIQTDVHCIVLVILKSLFACLKLSLGCAGMLRRGPANCEAFLQAVSASHMVRTSELPAESGNDWKWSHATISSTHVPHLPVTGDIRSGKRCDW